MALEILPLQEKHLEDAAVLVSARYRRLRGEIPALPLSYQDASHIYPRLRDLASGVPGVTALDGPRLVGFLLGFVVPSLRGKRAIYSPEWANAADLKGRRVYEEMYANLSERWVANGCFVHLISAFANDRDAIEGWPWLGFGMVAVDGVRDLNPALGPVAEIEIRRAGLDDIEPAMTLSEALQRHLAAAPTFLAYNEKPDRAFHKRWLAEQANALWLACDGSEVVACLGQGGASEKACDIIWDAKTTSIISAFTRKSARGGGIATALLNRALEWARSEGYERCAVDFEPMNLLAARFWTRHFAPVCYAFSRQVDERIAWAHAQREQTNLW
jgi:GNAT superfamily N-acetyltransferase